MKLERLCLECRNAIQADAPQRQACLYFKPEFPKARRCDVFDNKFIDEFDAYGDTPKCA